MVDKERLISAIFVREAIWDKTNKNHHNSMVLTKLWKEVAGEINQTSITAVKSQWKRLRETFAKKLAELPPKRSGDASSDNEDQQSDWPYFESLLFLKKQCTPRESSGNFSGNKDSEISEFLATEENENFNDGTSDILDDLTQSQGASLASSPANYMDLSPPLSTRSSVCAKPNPKQKQRKRTDSIGEALLKAELEKIEYLKNKSEKRHLREEKETDEDLAFFYSILPHVKKLSAKKKIKFRVQVLQLLDEEIPYELVNSNVPTLTFSQQDNCSTYSGYQGDNNLQSVQGYNLSLPYDRGSQQH